MTEQVVIRRRRNKMLSVPSATNAGTGQVRRKKLSWSWVSRVLKILLTAAVCASPAILLYASLPPALYKRLFIDNKMVLSTAKYYVLYYGSISCTASYIIYESLFLLLGTTIRLLTLVERMTNSVFPESIIGKAKQVEDLSGVVSGAVSITALTILTNHWFTMDPVDQVLVAGMPVQNKVDWLDVMLQVTKLCRFASMAAMTNLVTRFLCQRIQLYFHHEFYEERLEKSAFAMRCVRELRAERMNDVRMAPARTFTPASSILSVFTGRSEQSQVPPSDSSRFMGDIDVDSHADVVWFASALFKALVGDGDADQVVDVNNDTDSELDSVSSTTVNGKLSVGHLIPILGVQKGHRFFTVIDTKNKGDLSEDEFVESLEDVLLEDARLTKSIDSNNEIIKKLSRLLLFMSFTILVLLAAPVHILPSVATLGTMVLTFEFVFSSQISDAFNGLFFVIVSHPFDVGDEVVIDEEQAFVVEVVGLWGCQFREAEDNRLHYFSNSKLAKCRIANLRRSGDMCEHVYLELDAKTTTNERLLSFENQMTRQVLRHDRDFYCSGGKVVLSNLFIINANVLTCEFKVSHRANFQDRPLKARRSRLLTSCVRTALHRSKVHLAPFDYYGRWGSA